MIHADYRTKHHPGAHYTNMRPDFLKSVKKCWSLEGSSNCQPAILQGCVESGSYALQSGFASSGLESHEHRYMPTVLAQTICEIDFKSIISGTTIDS